MGVTRLPDLLKLGAPPVGQHRFVVASQLKPAPHWPFTHEPTGSLPLRQRTVSIVCACVLVLLTVSRRGRATDGTAQVRLQVAREADTALAIDARADCFVAGGATHCTHTQGKESTRISLTRLCHRRTAQIARAAHRILTAVVVLALADGHLAARTR